MTINEAIKTLKDEGCNYYRSPYQEYRDAIKLGIEALERLKSMRRDNITDAIFYLPSETED